MPELFGEHLADNKEYARVPPFVEVVVGRIEAKRAQIGDVDTRIEGVHLDETPRRKVEAVQESIRPHE